MLVIFVLMLVPNCFIFITMSLTSYLLVRHQFTLVRVLNKQANIVGEHWGHRDDIRCRQPLQEASQAVHHVLHKLLLNLGD